MKNAGCFAPLSTILVVASVMAGCGDYSDRTVSTSSPSIPTTVVPGASTAGAPSIAPPPPATSAAVEPTGPAPSEVAPSVPPVAVCEAVAACGGDVVGTWAAKSSCLTVAGNMDMTGFGLGCSESPTNGELAVSGNWTFTADGKVTDETLTTGSQDIDVLAACLTVSGTVTACDRLGGALPTLGFAAGTTCTDNVETGGCDCPATANQMGGAASIAQRPIKTGTYTVADNVISVKDNRMNLNAYSYCIQGDIMIATVASTPKAGPVTGQIVFQRQ